jgi:hypothetical protein
MGKRRLLISIFILCFGYFFSQGKKSLEHTYSVIKNLKPNEKFDYWAIYFFDGDQLNLLKQQGEKKPNEMHDTGFLKSPIDHSYYYIITEKGGKKNIIDNDEGVKKFIGKIDNVYEATTLMLLKGYFIDEEYQSIAGNYSEDAHHYSIDLALVSSENCPYAKTNYQLTVDKSSGLLLDVKAGSAYFEKYRKECKNNPHQQYRLNIKKP